MDIEELVNKKLKLKKDINNLIDIFNKETGITIKDICYTVEKIDSYSSIKKTNIELDI